MGRMGIAKAEMTRALPDEQPGPRPNSYWQEVIRTHNHRVVVYLLAMGLRADRASDIAQAAWVKLIESDRQGSFEHLELPGLAIAQARFLALDEIRRDRTDLRRAGSLAEDPSSRPEAAPSPELRLVAREQLARALETIAGCSDSARRVFRVLYEDPSISHADAAQRVGLSVQRVRQILCEVRKQLRTVLAEEHPRD
jgi:RNA polymerase sigma factor (sigma-70 family)